MDFVYPGRNIPWNIVLEEALHQVVLQNLKCPNLLAKLEHYLFKIPVVLLSRNCPVFPGLKLYHPESLLAGSTKDLQESLRFVRFLV